MQTKGMARPRTIYRERVTPGITWWLVLASLVAMISIAYGAALGTPIAVVVALVFTIVISWGIFRACPLVVVDETGLTCGAAVLPTTAHGSLRIVQGEELSAITRGLDTHVGDLGYAVVPAWAPRRAVVVEVDDPADPHSAWVVAARDPERLADALRHLH